MDLPSPHAAIPDRGRGRRRQRPEPLPPPEGSRRRWLWIPIALHGLSLLLPAAKATTGVFPGFVLWLASFPRLGVYEGATTWLAAAANAVFLLAVGLLAVQRGRGLVGGLIGAIAIVPLVAAIPVGVCGEWGVSDYPGYYVWAASFLALALLGGRIVHRELLVRRRGTKGAEALRVLALGLVPAGVLGLYASEYGARVAAAGGASLLPPALAASLTLGGAALLAVSLIRLSRRPLRPPPSDAPTRVSELVRPLHAVEPRDEPSPRPSAQARVPQGWRGSGWTRPESPSA